MITHPIPSVMFPECLLTLANTKFILFSSQEVTPKKPWLSGSASSFVSCTEMQT